MPVLGLPSAVCLRASARYQHVRLQNHGVTVTTIEIALVSGRSDHRQQLHQAVLRVYHLHEHASRGRLRRLRARVDMVLARPEKVLRTPKPP